MVSAVDARNCARTVFVVAITLIVSLLTHPLSLDFTEYFPPAITFRVFPTDNAVFCDPQLICPEELAVSCNDLLPHRYRTPEPKIRSGAGSRVIEMYALALHPVG